MGILTLTELKAELRANLGNRTDLNDRLTTILNLCQIRIARPRAWAEFDSRQEATLASTGDAKADKFLALPTNTRSIFSVRMILGTSESRLLTRRTYKQFDKNIPEPQYYARGKPTIYTVFKNSMELWKVPDDEYPITIRGTVWPTAFSDSLLSATSDLDHKDDMLVALATSWAFQSLRQGDDAARWFGIFNAMYKDAVSEDNENPDLDLIPERQIITSPSAEYWLNPFIKG